MTQNPTSTQSNGQITPQPSTTSKNPRPSFQPSRYTPSSPAARRDYLLRRKLDLEMEVQDLLAQLDSLDDEQFALDDAKATLRQQVPVLKKQVAVAGFFGTRQTPAERVFAFQVQRMAQEAARIEQQKIRSAHQLQAAHAKLALVDAEIDLLP